MVEPLATTLQSPTLVDRVQQELLKEDQAAMLPLPGTRFEAAQVKATRPNTLSLVRFDRNDYSVPVCWARHDVVVKGFCRLVRIFAQGREVARHRRIWDREQVAMEPVHYLALLERKPGSLDHALPLEGLEVPDCFKTLRRRLENERGSQGVREYVAVLRLLERHTMPRLRRAVDRALECGATSRDAVAQFLYPPEPNEAPVFHLEGRPHLQGVRVREPDLGQYSLLMGGPQ